MEKTASIGGVSVSTLKELLGTPLMIYDEQHIESRIQQYLDHFVSDTLETEIIYASKAFQCRAMLQLIEAYGLSLDVVSAGELFEAVSYGYAMERVYFHGNNKTAEEIKMAMDAGCGTMIVDNPEDCARILSISGMNEKPVHILIRINPGIEAHTHQYIITADKDSKFGISIDHKAEIAAMVNQIAQSEYAVFDGFHYHIGSQITRLDAYIKTMEVTALFLKEMQDSYQIEAPVMNLGGGYGVRYTQEDQPFEIDELCRCLISHWEALKKQYGLAVKKIMIEPGRSIVAEAGSTLYTAGCTKKTENRSYVFVDGGMADNIRPALYQAKYECMAALKLDLPHDIPVTLAGKCCESGDILIEKAFLPPIEDGDLILVKTTGAYGYSMASNYNRCLKPAVVFVKEGNVRVVVRRESYLDLLRLECDELVYKKERADDSLRQVSRTRQ